jgi:DNA repair protein RadC
MAAYVPAYKMALVRDGSVKMDKRPQLTTPQDVGKLALRVLPDDGREHFFVFLLDVRNRVVGIVPVSIGSMSNSIINPRDVFGVSIVHKAAGVILVHNHPSSDPTPSEEDVAISRRLFTAGALLGVDVLDHLIVGSGTDSWVSLKERGLM